MMREPEMQLEHRVIIAASVIAASGPILNGVNELSKIRRELLIRIMGQQPGAGHKRRQRPTEFIRIVIGPGPPESDPSNTERIVFLLREPSGRRMQAKLVHTGSKIRPCFSSAVWSARAIGSHSSGVIARLRTQ